MIRAVGDGLVIAALSLNLAGQDPDDLRRKDQKPAVQKADTPREDPKKIIERIGRKFRETDERFDERDLGERAVELQDQIIKELDRLSRENDNNDGNDARSGSGNQGRQGSRSRANRDSRGNADDKGGNVRNPAGDKKDPQSRNNVATEGGRKGDGTGTERKDPSKAPTVSDLHPGAWDPLPLRKRQEMDAYAKDRFPPKHEQLLREYFRTIVEENKRRDVE